MRILFAAAEVYPFASTGGLAGVMGSLPVALERTGHQVSIIMPMYRDIVIEGELDWVDSGLTTSAGESFGLARTGLPGSGVDVLLVSKDEYFHRPGLYGPDDGSSYEDNAMRFSFFCRAVTAFCESTGSPPDVVHCHDWQTGLVPAYLRNSIRPAVVFTIHNLHYQGNFPAGDYACTRLPRSIFNMDGLEFYGSFSFMKSGIVYADRITTVSGTYASEIQQPELGEGMDGLLRKRSEDLTGILNGIDYEKWNPESDNILECSYSAESISPRRKCRRDLLRGEGLELSNFTVGIVSRLTRQKGLDVLFPVAEDLIGTGTNLVVLGTGEKKYIERLAHLGKKHPGNVSLHFRYDEDMARRIFAGSDAILMPSRFEPCGLAQMIGMRYGAIPMVRRTGGLADTVEDVDSGGCGFVMKKTTPGELHKCLKRAHDLYNSRNRWSWLVKRAMQRDNSWSSRVTPYEAVYRKAAEKRRAR